MAVDVQCDPVTVQIVEIPSMNTTVVVESPVVSIVDHATQGPAGPPGPAGIPGVHTHTESDITDLDKYTQAEVDTALGGKADTVHSHTKSDITDFSDGDYATAAQGSTADSALQNITGESIKTLSDVLSSMTPTDGQVLTFDTTNGWQAETLPAGITDHTLLSNIGTNTHAQIDTHIADATIHFTQASISITESQISDLGVYIPTSEKAVADGVATLDSGGLVPVSQLPPIAITDTFVVASEVAMLALTAETGDVAIRSDESKSYILKGTDPSVLGDWEFLQTPTDTVLSVDGRTGVVTLSDLYEAKNANIQSHIADITTNPHSVTKAQVGLGNVDNTSDLAKPISTATQTALDGKANTVHSHVKADITDFSDGDYATAAQGILADSALQDITGESIKSLSDVLTSMTPVDGQVLTYDTTNGWQAETIPAGVTDHTLLSNIGTNTHAQIDTHIADGTIHFTQASISITESQISDLGNYSVVGHSHVKADITDFSDGDYATAAQGTLADSALQNITGESIKSLSDVFSTMTPTDGQVLTYDTTNGWQSETPVDNDTTDHTALSNIGTNTHAQLDTHLADGSIHFTEASISITESQISDLQAYLLDITGEPIDDLDDVIISVPTNGQVLTYETSTSKWKNQTPISGITDHTLLSNIGTNTHAQIDTHIANTSNPHAVTKTQVLSGDLIVDADVDTGAAISASKIEVERIAGSTYSTSQHFNDVLNSVGAIGYNSGDIVDDTDGTITVSIGDGLIRATDSDVAQILSISWSAESGANVSLTDNDLNYIYVEYNAGTPQVIATTTKRTNYNTNIFLGNVYRSGTDLHITNVSRIQISDAVVHIIKRFKETEPFQKSSGATLAETGTRNFSISAGSFWEGLKDYTTDAKDTSVADTFSYFYSDGAGGFTEVTAQTQINNTQYDDGTGTLATLGNAKYGVHWIFLGADSDLYVVFGLDSYGLADAIATDIPSNLPPHFEDHGKIVGRIIILKDAAVFIAIETENGASFGSTGATDHGDLIGLSDDDHTQYHNDARGDARYYQQTEFLNASAGAGDAGKPIKLDAAGHVDITMINDADIDHVNIGSIGTNSHAAIDTHIADGTIHFTQAAISITESQISDFGSYEPALGYTAENTANKGTANGYASLGADTKIPTSQLPAIALTDVNVVASEAAQLALTVQEGDVAVRTDLNRSYAALNDVNATMADWQELLTPTDAVLSVNSLTGAVTLTHDGFADYVAAEHFTEASIDHVNILNIGTNNHAAIDSHIADGTIHFTQASISITESQISDLQSYLLDITGESIKTLSDVFSTMTPTDGQVLTYDTTNGWQSETPVDNDTTDHTLLSNIGTNTHPAIDTHIADGTVHFTQAAISITESQVSDLQSYLLNITGESIKDLSDVFSTMTPTDGQVLTYDTTNGWQAEDAAAGGTAPTMQKFTDGDSTTFTPTAGAIGFKVTITAPGGGGGGADLAGGRIELGAGGGAGGTSIVYYNAEQMGANATMAHSAGGVGGSTTGSNGTAGGTISFNPAGTGVTLSATGGSGGQGENSVSGEYDVAAGGAGGTGSGSGALNIDGGGGMAGSVPSSVYVGKGYIDANGGSGAGGASFWGGGGQGRSATEDATGTTAAWGAGGGGGADDDVTGTAGQTGGASMIFIEEFYG